MGGRFYTSREETTQPQKPDCRLYERSVSTDSRCEGVGCTSGRQKQGGCRRFMRPHKESVSSLRMRANLGERAPRFTAAAQDPPPDPHPAPPWSEDTQTRERLSRMWSKIYDCVSICANVSAAQRTAPDRVAFVRPKGLRICSQNRRLGKEEGKRGAL